MLNENPLSAVQNEIESRSIFQKIFGLASIKLILALLGIFMFFAVSIGVQEAINVHNSNKKILKDLENKGVAPAEREKDSRLQSSWSQGFYGSQRFLAKRNFETIARQTTIVGLAALGMTLIIIAGGIDLSVGSMVAFSSTVIAWLLHKAGTGPFTAAIGGVAAGALCGLLSGTLITALRVVPFIVTLGMMLIVRGGAKWLGHNQKIDVESEQLFWLDDLMATVPKDHAWMLLPLGVWMLVIMAVLVALLLRYTRLGRHIFAIGSNEQTARLCGVAVWKAKVMVFMLGGAFAGMAGLMQFSRLTVGDPTVAMGLELDVIAAVVIGGGSLSGGEGSILGTLVGALIMSVIASGCTQLGLQNYWQEIITGIIIVVAVALDRLRHRHTV